MPNIFHQSVEDILKAATSEQRLLWNYVFLRWGERVPIAQLFFQGALAGSEFSVYSANKIYVAYQLGIRGGTAGGVQSAIALLYNELNVQFYVLADNTVYWDATAAAVRYMSNNTQNNNLWFSRIVLQNVSDISFIGYRLTI